MTLSRFDLRIDVSAVTPGVDSSLAATLVLDEAVVDGPRRLAVAFPGGGYSRGYWDIQWSGADGYSEAEYHAALGWIFVAVDHLGVGESTQPDPNTLTFEVLAAANASATRSIVAGLRVGSLVAALDSLEISHTIGIGQSMGGCLTIVTQALEPTFDGIAVLGYSGIHTVLPSPTGGVDVEAIERGTIEEGVLARTSEALLEQDIFQWAFHFEDVDPALRAADLGEGYPMRLGTPPPWGSPTIPPAAVSMLSPGAVAQEAATVDVPVFVGVGERDVCPDPWAEPSAYRGSHDVTLVVIPRMAHMHNFAGSRAQMWRRIHAWGSAI
jgi:pimeloyl-ACP methyl ester carboxylesterase